MRPLKITPGHPITALALSPDGRQLGVVQSQPGFRIFDTLTGAEVARDVGREYVRELSPTGRHFLEADRAAIRLAEVAAGRPFLRFQTGWTNTNCPPLVPETSALPAGTISWYAPNTPTPRNPSSVLPWYLNNGALSADHRFAVGRLNRGDDRFGSVRDLATERTIATLDLTLARPVAAPVQFRFTPDNGRVVAATAHMMLVFGLPPPLDLDAPPKAAFTPAFLGPTVKMLVTQPQATPGVPPFAVLPCGRSVIVRGEKSRVELRDLATGEVLTVWKWGLPRLDALAVAGDGLTAAAAGPGGQVVIWDLG